MSIELKDRVLDYMKRNIEREKNVLKIYSENLVKHPDRATTPLAQETAMSALYIIDLFTRLVEDVDLDFEHHNEYRVDRFEENLQEEIQRLLRQNENSYRWNALRIVTKFKYSMTAIWKG
jgi:hypothetical protein